MAEFVTLYSAQAPGDFVVMTAGLRDLALQYPGLYKFSIKLDPGGMAVFENNPHVSLGPWVGRQVKMQYSHYRNPYSIKTCNQSGAHFLWGYIGDLNLYFNLGIRLSEFRPALYLSESEKASVPFGLKKPYWVFVGGGKTDFSAKWWDPDDWQEVVRRMPVPMVQVGGGSSNHRHPPIDNTINLVGKTSTRELIRLIYHSEGVMCIVTCLMHIAAAFNKPCIVVAGGREPETWEAYTEKNRLFNMRLGNPAWQLPNDGYVYHKYLHTMNKLPCCTNKGCWKDAVHRFSPGQSLCSDLVKRRGQYPIPKCLSLITPDMVMASYEEYVKEGVVSCAQQKGVPV